MAQACDRTDAWGPVLQPWLHSTEVGVGWLGGGGGGTLS